MQEITSQRDVAENALINYRINGIQDEEQRKVILCIAKNQKELKANFEVYERMARVRIMKKENIGRGKITIKKFRE